MLHKKLASIAFASTFFINATGANAAETDRIEHPALSTPLVTTPDPERRADTSFSKKVREAALCILTHGANKNFKVRDTDRDENGKATRRTVECKKHIIAEVTNRQDTNTQTPNGNESIELDEIWVEADTDVPRNPIRMRDLGLDGNLNEATASSGEIIMSDLRPYLSESRVLGENKRDKLQAHFRACIMRILAICGKK
ncbi:hypothetical protein HYV58_01035 [Candidatus Peregrinibacteria bacterium]|nr:hypothetical protein [Candidatus Peregrinibacteria bacterium]